MFCPDKKDSGVTSQKCSFRERDDNANQLREPDGLYGCDARWIQRRLAAELADSKHLNSPPCLHLPSTLQRAKTHRDCKFDASSFFFFFLLSLSSSYFFIPPYLFLPTIHLIHHVPTASPSPASLSLSLSHGVSLFVQGKKKKNSNSGFQFRFVAVCEQ